MNYIIRKLRQEEVKILDTFLYEAIFIPERLCSQSEMWSTFYKCIIDYLDFYMCC